MSWKRCWNNGFNGHGSYESEDDQIVPDIDRRTSSSSSSSLSSASSATSVDSPSASSVSIRQGGIDTQLHHHHHSHHHHQAPSSSSIYRPVSSASSSSSHHRNFPSKRDTFANNAVNSNGNNNSISMGNGGGMFSGGSSRSGVMGSTGRTSPLSDHYRVFAFKTSPSNSTTSSPFSWNGNANKSALDGTGEHYFGKPVDSANGHKRSALELNDFWEEKYSRIAVITTTTNHFGGQMAHKF